VPSERRWARRQASSDQISGNPQLSMAEALSRLIPNADGRLILVIRHRHVQSVTAYWDTALHAAIHSARRA
jgi:hypothetical protein